MYSVELDSWKENGLCRDERYPTSWWHPEAREVKNYSPENLKAIEICLKCPVKDECLQFAFDTGEYEGTWGAIPAVKRVRKKADYKQLRTCQKCGIQFRSNTRKTCDRCFK